MRKAALIIPLVVAGMTFAQRQDATTVTGFVTDTWCGRKGASEKHAEHARRSVASGKAKYALYVETQAPTARGASIDGKLYILDSGQWSVAGGQGNLERLFAQYAGQRLRITGTVSATPIRHAGQSYAPDAVATVRVNGASRPVNATTATPATTADPSVTGATSGQARVQQHHKALDTTTPVAGILTIAAVEIAPR